MWTAQTQGLQPRFVQGESPTDADIAAVVQKISRRVIRTLRRSGVWRGAWKPRGHRV